MEKAENYYQLVKKRKSLTQNEFKNLRSGT
jgi:hypothetical protein